MIAAPPKFSTRRFVLFPLYIDYKPISGSVIREIVDTLETLFLSVSGIQYLPRYACRISFSRIKSSAELFV